MKKKLKQLLILFSVFILFSCKTSVDEEKIKDPLILIDGAINAEKYLMDELPELEEYGKYIYKNSNGKATLTVESSYGRLYDLYDDQKKYLDKYYLIYVGESWKDHRANWDWFYVNQDINEILWYDLVEGTVYSITEWRNSDKYKLREVSLEGK